jgi:predicted short-subunit dehydrogenase-like oxidoreductase (DUF2520 family)
MTYTLIGTGNMAWFLASRLAGKGFECKGVYGRDMAAAELLAEELFTETIPDLNSIPDTYDCCIVAVSDKAVGNIVSQLNLKETVVIHTAGVVSLENIDFTHKAVVWFIYSISKTSLPNHRAIPAVIEASTPKAMEAVRSIAMEMSDIVQEASFHQREWLHLTAVFANNFTNHLLAISEKACQEQELPFTLLKPILYQTFDRIEASSAVDLQTGPARRGDEKTMNRHLEMLGKYPHWRKIYEAASASIEDMYKRKS